MVADALTKALPKDRHWMLRGEWKWKMLRHHHSETQSFESSTSGSVGLSR
jgi:hypothetical protein